MAKSKRKFVDGIEEMLKRTPKKNLKGTVVVDQVYAHYQHANPHFFHPSGGEAFYLTTPLFQKADHYMRELGRGAIQRRIQTVMRDNMEDLTAEVKLRAPIDFGDLGDSGQPFVERDGKVVYHRPPVARRLTEEELRRKNQLSRLLEPHRYRRG